ncbi:MAG: TIGR02301 family protein [Rhizobiales bacterium]|nr:TIGR02301 family protein [Hyphomicrobiales bacterium]
MKVRSLWLASLLLGAALSLPATVSSAQLVEKSYGDRLLRLAEILGAIHHLRDICGANEGQLWREKMLEMLEAEAPPGQFRARLIAAFNNGFRGYRRTYSSCTASAKTAENRFLTEGSELATGLTDTLAASLAEAEDEGGSSAQ